MSTRLVVGAIAIGALFFAVGVFLTPMIGATNAQAQTAVELAGGESETVQQNLDVRASINATNATTEFTTVNTRSYLAAETGNLSVGQSETVSVGSENVTVTYERDAGEGVVASVEYPPTFGYEENAKLFYENLDLLLAALGLLIAVGGSFVGVRGA